MPMPHAAPTDLIPLLHRRLEVIADTGWRERDPEAQLAELQRVGTELMERHAALKGHLPARLDHFLTQCSYDKALALLEGRSR